MDVRSNLDGGELEQFKVLCSSVHTLTELFAICGDPSETIVSRAKVGARTAIREYSYESMFTTILLHAHEFPDSSVELTAVPR